VVMVVEQTRDEGGRKGTAGGGARGFYLMPDLRLPDMWRHGDTEAHLVSGRRIDV
jgi:hypothetical protein